MNGNPAVPTCQRAENIIGTVDCARRGTLVRQVPPAGEPAESAAKKCQCDRSHRSKKRDECAIRVSAEEGESLEWNNNDSTTQSEEGQLGKTSAVFEVVPHQPPRRQQSRALEESTSVEKTPIGGASREPLSPGNPMEPGLRQVVVKAMRSTDQVNTSYTAFFHLILKPNAHPGTQCPKNHRRSNNNKLAITCMYPGEGASCNA